MYLKPWTSSNRNKVVKMLKFLSVLIVCLPLGISISPGLMLGPGRWLVENIMPCDNPEQYDVLFNIIRKKINRTHDGFNFAIDLDREFNYSYNLDIIVYKKVDGGFKYYQTISDDSACALLMRVAEQNVKKILALANIDPPDCPIPAGRLEIVDFVFNYKELPKIGVYGMFEAISYVSYKGTRIGCVKTFLNFDKHDDDDDDDDDYGLF